MSHRATWRRLVREVTADPLLGYVWNYARRWSGEWLRVDDARRILARRSGAPMRAWDGALGRLEALGMVRVVRRGAEDVRLVAASCAREAANWAESAGSRAR